MDKLKEELKKITAKEVQINIFEIKRPSNSVDIGFSGNCSIEGHVSDNDIFIKKEEIYGSIKRERPRINSTNIGSTPRIKMPKITLKYLLF